MIKFLKTAILLLPLLILSGCDSSNENAVKVVNLCKEYNGILTTKVFEGVIFDTLEVDCSMSPNKE